MITSMNHFFHVSIALTSTDELTCHVLMPMRYQMLYNHNLEQLPGLELCKDMTK